MSTMMPMMGPGMAPAVFTDRRPQATYRDHAKHVKDLIQQFDYFQEVLISRRSQEVRWWRRYLADASLVDTRTEDEKKWRSLVMLPYGYSGIQSLVAHLVDMLMGPSPVFTARGRGPEDRAAAANERLVNYTFVELNRLASFAEEAFTRGAVQGMDVWKMSWRDEWITHNFRPSAVDDMRFKAAVAQAEQASGIEAPGLDELTGEVSLVEWQRWVAAVADMGIQIPAIPAAGPRRVRSFVGPWLRSVELYDLAYDPKQPDFQRQHCIFHRVIVPRAWLEREAKRHPDRYDAEAIADLPKSVVSGGTGRSVSEQQADILDALDIAESPGDDPYYADAVELIEFTRPEDEECAWGIIGNHDRLITRNPQDYPYKTRMQPWAVYYNVPTPGAAVGVSEYQQNGQLHEVADKALMAMVDYSMLQTMPILAHRQGIGMGGPLAAPKPGDIIELEPEEELSQPLAFDRQLAVSENTIRFIKGEIDETSGVFSSVRGAPAEINRVSATESQGRQNASMARPKGRLYRFADAMAQGPIPFSFGLWKQYGEPAMLENIAGLDPSTALAEDALVLGLTQNYVMAAAAISADAAMQTKQFDEGIQALGPQGLGLIQPGSRAALAIAKARLIMARTPNTQEIVQAIEQDLAAAQQAAPPQGGPGAPPPDAETPQETAAEGGVEEPGEAPPAAQEGVA